MTKQLNLSNLIDAYFAWERTVLFTLGALVLILMSMYIYLVSVSISNIALLQDGETKISQLESEIGSLEAEYMTLSSNITLAKALDRGFIELAGGGVFVASQDRHVVSLGNTR